MDFVLYDPPLPELPLLAGLWPWREEAEAPAPGFDWGTYVIRLAQAVAQRQPDPA